MPTSAMTMSMATGASSSDKVATYQIAPRKVTIPPQARIIDRGGAYRSSGPCTTKAATISQAPKIKKISGMPVDRLRPPTPTRERSITIPNTMRNTPPVSGAHGTRSIFDSVKSPVIPVYSSIVIVGRGLRRLSSDVVVYVVLLEVSRVHVLLDLSEHKDPLVGGRMGHEELGCFPPVGL